MLFSRSEPVAVGLWARGAQMRRRLFPALSLSALVAASCSCWTVRSTNPVREPSGNAHIKIDRVSPDSQVAWSFYRLSNAWKDVASLEDAERAAKSDSPPSVASGTVAASANGEAILPRGNYGEAYLLHVKEVANNATVRDTVTYVDDRPKASGGGVHVSLLFVPHLDAAITSTQFSLYPARLWAIDCKQGTSVAAWVDGLSIDTGIAGASVIGDAPEELGGRVAFTFGGGYTFDEGWAVKIGSIVYRDATDHDKLANAFYLGLSYDLLSGLTSK